MIDTLKKSLLYLNADRAIIAKIHPISPGSEQLVFSILFEELSVNTNSLYDKIQNTPCSVLDLEFKNKIESIIVANKNIKGLSSKCTNHLDNIGMDVILNQLLIYGGYTWGVLSFQFIKCPSFVKDDYIDVKYEEYIKNCKNKINNCLTT